MLQSYIDKKDLYAIIASKVYHNNYEDNLEKHADGTGFPEGKHRRKVCKSILLGISYGMSAASLGERINTTAEEAQAIIDEFYKGFPKVKQWMDKTEQDALRDGFVTDLWGRKRRLPELLLPQYEVKADGGEGDFNPLLGCKNIYQNPNNKEVSNIRQKLLECKNYKEKLKIKDEAKKKGITVIDNGGYISRSLRQCVNARIQGSAASMTKKAMIAVHNDPIINELGFKLLIPVHDELIGECPKENAEKVAARLSELMINSAKEKCVTPMKCDAEITSRWYETDYLDELKKDLDKLIEEKGLSKEEAKNQILSEHPEICIFSQEVIDKTLDN